MSHREALVAAAEGLLWERGYEAMSPQAVLRVSGAGQGSMYHHFDGKKSLAIEALVRHESVLWERTMATLGNPEAGAFDAILAWLNSDRDALVGCRLGRLVNESSVRADGELRAPITRYFERLHELLIERIEQATERGELGRSIDPSLLADLLIAAIQGGYVLALATGDATRVATATTAATQLLHCYASQQSGTR